MSIDAFGNPNLYPFIAVEGNKVKGYWEGGAANEFQVYDNGINSQAYCNQSRFEEVMTLIITWLNNKYFNQQFEADGSILGPITEPYISA